MVKKQTNNIRTVFSISLIILLVSSATSYFSIEKLLDSQQWVNHTFKVIENLDFIISRIKDAETGQRGYLLSGDKVFLEPYTGSQSEVTAAFYEAARLTNDNTSQQRDFPKLELLIAHKFHFIEKTIKDEEKGIPVTVSTLLGGKKIMDSIRTVIKVMENREEVLLRARESKLSNFVHYTPIVIAAGALIAMLVSLVFYKRVQANLLQNTVLEAELQQKQKDTAQQIDMITNMAKKISEGDYATRIKTDDPDNNKPQ